MKTIRYIVKKVLDNLAKPKRSDKWPSVRRHHLLVAGWCAYCGGVVDLEVHHIEPFHLNPEKELDPNNLITLCETVGKECHLKQGHLGNWKDINPNIRNIARVAAPANQ